MPLAPPLARSALVFVLAWSLAGPAPGARSGRNAPLTAPEEAELGARLAAELSARLPLVEDAAGLRLLDELSRRLQAAHGPGLDGLSLHVVEDEARDAFTVPGRHVFLTTGMVRGIGSEEQWAAVLSHQLAHVVHRHALKRLQGSYGRRVLEDILGGEREETLSGIAANVASAGLFARNSLEAEREADDTAKAFPGDGGGQDGLLAYLLSQRDERLRPFPTTRAHVHRHEVTQARLQAARLGRPEREREDFLLAELREWLDSEPHASPRP